MIALYAIAHATTEIAPQPSPQGKTARAELLVALATPPHLTKNSPRGIT